MGTTVSELMTTPYVVPQRRHLQEIGGHSLNESEQDMMQARLTDSALLRLGPSPYPSTLEFLLQLAGFSHMGLISAIMEPLSTPEITRYLSNWDDDQVRDKINLSHASYPPLFYAAKTNDCKLVRLLIEMGARHDICGKHAIPLLAWIILNDHPQSFQMVATLLSLGCSTDTIPLDMFEDIIGNPEDVVAEEVRSKTPWCTPALRIKLARRINLSHRYLLNKASKQKPPPPYKLQVARCLKISGLFGMPYFIVGQEIATKIVCIAVLSHLSVKSFHPLVMAFVGHPGHGKTELALQMGELLSTSIIIIDCTEMEVETDLFGPKAPYIGHEAGSPLNNHLAKEQGKRTVVFLDEFDKTTEAVRQSLLILFDQGKYKDRRDPSLEYDCSQTIWILATNLGEKNIHEFCQQQPRSREDISLTHVNAHVDDLCKRIRNTFLHAFKGPLTGRITTIAPFLTFNALEQAAIAHRFILRFAAEIRPSVCFSEHRFIGNINLKVGMHPADGDGPVCALLAEEGYHPELGARSLEQVVDRLVKMPLVDLALDDEEVEDAADKEPLTLYSVDHRPTGSQDHDGIVVRRIPSDPPSGEF